MTENQKCLLILFDQAGVKIQLDTVQIMLFAIAHYEWLYADAVDNKNMNNTLSSHFVLMKTVKNPLT